MAAASSEPSSRCYDAHLDICVLLKFLAILMWQPAVLTDLGSRTFSSAEWQTPETVLRLVAETCKCGE